MKWISFHYLNLLEDKCFIQLESSKNCYHLWNIIEYFYFIGTRNSFNDKTKFRSNKWNSSAIENTVLTFNFPYLVQILKIYRPWKPISNYKCQIKTFALLLQKNINSK